MGKGSGWMQYGHQKVHVRCCRWCLGMAKPVGEREDRCGAQGTTRVGKMC